MSGAGREAHDVVVIGAGVVGTALAYFLAKAGQDVCVLDRGVAGMQASGRNAGGVRQNQRPEAELPLAMRSIQLWKMLAEESDLDFEYRRHGNLILIWNEADSVEAKALVGRQRALGLDCYYLDRAETRALVPAVREAYVGGIYSPTCGSAEPYRACLALARMATRLGATIYEHRQVTGVHVVHDRVSAVLTGDGPIGAGVVVNAAGAWAPAIGRMVGVELPINLCRSHLLVTEPLPLLLEPFVSAGDHGYFRQTPSGNVLIGFGSLPVPDFEHRLVTYEAMTTSARRAATLLPHLRDASVIRAFTGFTAWTPDLAPLVGFVEQPAGFLVAAEFNGTGFAMGPVIGELLTELILERRTSYSIHAFSPERFRRHLEEGAATRRR